MAKKILFLILLNFSFQSHAQMIELIKFVDLKKRVTNTNDSLYVLNFWATWCKPCIQELPYFETCNEEFSKTNVKIILVNLDFNSQVNKTAEPFVKRKNLKSSIVHITETDSDSWINKVDSTWSGAIPATIIFKNGKKLFFKEGPVTEAELREVLKINLLK